MLRRFNLLIPALFSVFCFTQFDQIFAAAKPAPAEAEKRKRGSGSDDDGNDNAAKRRRPDSPEVGSAPAAAGDAKKERATEEDKPDEFAPVRALVTRIATAYMAIQHMKIGDIVFFAHARDLKANIVALRQLDSPFFYMSFADYNCSTVDEILEAYAGSNTYFYEKTGIRPDEGGPLFKDLVQFMKFKMASREHLSGGTSLDRLIQSLINTATNRRFGKRILIDEKIASECNALFVNNHDKELNVHCEGSEFILNKDNAPKIWEQCELFRARLQIKEPIQLVASHDDELLNGKACFTTAKISVGMQLLKGVNYIESIKKDAFLRSAFGHEFGHIWLKHGDERIHHRFNQEYDADTVSAVLTSPEEVIEQCKNDIDLTTDAYELSEEDTPETRAEINDEGEPKYSHPPFLCRLRNIQRQAELIKNDPAAVLAGLATKYGVTYDPAQ